MPSGKAREIIQAAFDKGYERGFREGQQMALAGRRQTPRRIVASELLDRLEERPQPAEAMLALSQEFSVSVDTVRRAAKEAGVFPVKRGDCWLWVHPKQAPPPIKMCKVGSQLAFSVESGTIAHTHTCHTA